MRKIKVYAVGVSGQMGQEVIRTVAKQEDMQLVGASDVRNIGADAGAVAGISPLGVEITGPVESETLRASQAEVLVDFTGPQAVFKNIKTAIAAGVAPVVGTTGLKEQELAEIRALVDEAKLGAFLAPNFAIGAILMMRFAQEAAKYFPHVDIIELHHDRKLDAPSGTALRTGEEILKVRGPMVQGHPEEHETVPGARGANLEGIHIHSVRLPGLVAHQEILFGGLGQTLTIRHDAFSRETYMPGVMLAVRKVLELKGLVVGLENLLD